MKAVIVAGGKGTRLTKYTNKVPKPMIKVDGISLLERQIVNLKNNGVHEFIIIVGYLGNIIIDYFKDGSKFGIKIQYLIEKKPLGSAGSLFFLKKKIKEDFVLTFADLIIDVNFKKMMKYHKSNKSLLTLFTHPNSHPYDSDLLILNDKNQVIGFDSKNNNRNSYWYHNIVNAGVFIISPKALTFFKKPIKTDMEHDFIASLIKTKKVYSYHSSEYVKDAGTIERLKTVEDDIKTNIVSERNLSKQQKCIFLDRDGTINVYKGHLDDISKFELLPGVSEAIKKINRSKYLVIVITNQPIISRGGLTFKGLDDIHKKMETLLGNDGAYLDAIYFCPHYPESGFKGEIKRLKINCKCRKPKIGLLLKAKKAFNIDLNSSWFIGDSEIDIKCGKNAGCKTILIGPNKSSLKPNFSAKNLLAAANIILKSN